MIRDGGYGSLLGNPASIFAGGGVTSGMMSNGQSLISRIFGNRASSVSNALASSSGVKPGSAGTLMSLLAPLTLGVVGKQAGSQGLNAAGITNLLRGQKREITEATPSELSHILGFGGGPVSAPTASALYEERDDAPNIPAPSATFVHEERAARTTPAPSALYEERAATKKWPWVLVALAVLGLLLYLLSRGRRPAEPTANVAPTAPSAAPANPPAAAPPAPSAAPANTTPLPGPSNVYFDTASSQLTPESRQTLDNFEAALKANPDAQVQVAGHTDNTGNAQANQQLSLNRANAVKAMLVSDGIDANRISTVGDGEDDPVASNDTAQGRAQNRRTELSVIGK